MKRTALVAIFLLSLLPQGNVGAQTAKGSIYTCIDAQGNKLTSDRYIAACSDREQRQLDSSGVVKQIVPPTYTGQQRAELEAKRKAAENAEAQQKAQVRAANALLQRYPTAGALMASRLQDADEVVKRIHGGYLQLADLQRERIKADEEMAFYQKDPGAAPPRLKALIQANTDGQASAQKYIAQQRQSLVDLHRRYDADAATLAPLWAK